MVTQAATAITELHTDDQHSGCGEAVSETNKIRVGRTHKYHAAPVGMDDTRDVAVALFRLVDVERYLIIIYAADHFSRSSY